MSGDQLAFFIPIGAVLIFVPFTAFVWLVALRASSSPQAQPNQVNWACSIFGIRSETDTEKIFGNAIWTRYGLPMEEGTADETCKQKKSAIAQIEDRALTYVERVIDRQINKVRGILTLDSILIVASRELITQDKEKWRIWYFLIKGLLEFGTYCLILAIGLSVYLLFVRIGNDENIYCNIQAEFNETIELIRKRAIPIQISVWASLLAILLFSMALLASWGQADATPAQKPPSPPATAHMSPHDIFFDVNAAVPRRESETALMAALQELEDKPTLKVRLEGHADDSGSVASNQKLSRDRANAVMNWLIKRRIVKRRPIGTPDRRRKGTPSTPAFAIARRRSAKPLAERSA
jgi:hypothetical protein